MLCIYCNQRKADTVDHVPPKCIFPPGTKEKMITIPACSACNNCHSVDDEYFKLALTVRVGNDSKFSKELSLSTSKSLEKNKKLDSFLIKNIVSLNDTKIIYSWKEFRPYIINEIERITKAIYFDIYKQRLAEDTTIEVFDEFKSNMSFLDIFKDIEVIPFKRNTNPNIFSCEYSVLPHDQNSGLWRYNFYNCFFPHAITLSSRMQNYSK